MKQYERVIDHIENLIRDGQVRPGKKLPSIRELSTALGFSPSTIIKAYQLLEERHQIYILPKSGAYLMDLGYHRPRQDATFDFSRMVPDPALLPYKAYLHGLDLAIERYKSDLFKYAEPEGLHDLRESLQRHLSERHVVCPLDNIFVTSGSQQAITLMAQCIHLATGKGILLEQPSYHVFQEYLQLYDIPCGGFARRLQGIDFNDLKSKLQTGLYAALYIMPHIHNPLGTSLSTAEKKRVVQLAERYGVTLIEDDYLTDLVPLHSNLPLYYYSTTKDVVYIKSFSKSFLPGIRIGACVVPDPYRETFLRLKKAHDLSTPVLTQGALDSFLKHQLYERHVKRCRQHYARKAKMAAKILSAITHPDVEVGTSDSGFIIWLGFSSAFPYKEWLEHCRSTGLILSEGTVFSPLSPDPSKGVRICIAPFDDDRLQQALTHLVCSFDAFEPALT